MMSKCEKDKWCREHQTVHLDDLLQIDNNNRWIMKIDIDNMILNFMALTSIITKKEVQKLTDKIYDRIEEEG